MSSRYKKDFDRVVFLRHARGATPQQLSELTDDMTKAVERLSDLEHAKRHLDSVCDSATGEECQSAVTTVNDLRVSGRWELIHRADAGDSMRFASECGKGEAALVDQGSAGFIGDR